MSKDRNRGGRETRKPKKQKPAAKPAVPADRIPGKAITEKVKPE